MTDPQVIALPAEAPPGFQWVRTPGAQALAGPEAAGWIRFVLEGGKTLYEAASHHPHRSQLEGRWPLFVVPVGTSRKVEASVTSPSPGEVVSGEEHWVVRHYARGGSLVPRLLGDRFLRLGRTRPFHELEASEEARARGIRTPKIAAAAMYPAGPFYRADLVTVFVPGATDLVESLFDTSRKGVGGAVERRDALQAAGELIRQLASKGLRHRDLHAGNVLLEWRGAAPDPILADLDRCQVMPERAEASPLPMYRRLRRSLRKWERRTGLRIAENEWETLERAVAP
jgi:hypothetical protein